MIISGPEVRVELIYVPPGHRLRRGRSGELTIIGLGGQPGTRYRWIDPSQQSLPLSWYSSLGELISDITHTITQLRGWWPELHLHITLHGSAAAAKAAARRDGLTLPR